MENSDDAITDAMTDSTQENAGTNVGISTGAANAGSYSLAQALGARVAVRVLVIARNAAAEDAAAREAAGVEAMPRLRAWLEAAGHTVSVAPISQWQDAAAATHPDLVLLEIGESASHEAAPADALEICRALKTETPRLLILAVVPAGISAASEEQTSALWSSLRAAGADDFVFSDLSRAALEARVLLMARLFEAAREAENGIEQLARHTQVDETTQLLNRRFFFQNAHRECSRARRYGHVMACLMVDIDYLDEMNKTFGYGCVEYVLRAVAYTVRQWTRDSDISGRFNERKFVVLLPETDIEGATAVREKILGALEESQFAWEGKELPISVSIGESERRHERPVAASTSPDEKSASEIDSNSEDPAFDEMGTEPLSVREELASLLEDADGALNVARRATLRPGIFVQYTPGE